MEIIDTRIDPSGDEYKANYDHNLALVAELDERMGVAREERSERSMKRLAEKSKMPMTKRIEALLDPNTPFLELSTLAAYGMYDGKVHSGGNRGGIGIVHGREFVIGGSDPTVKGGSVYPIGMYKTMRLQEIAMENRLPSINLIDSGGGYLPLQDEIFIPGGGVFYNQAITSKMGLPMICAVLGECIAGGAYVPAMSTYVIMVKGNSGIFLGGPPLVRAATGEVVTSDELGGADVHCSISGVADYFAEDEAHALHICRDLAENISVNEKTITPAAEPKPPLYDPKELYGIIPRDEIQPFDVREVIARIVDGSRFNEFKTRWGTTLVTGFARIHGYEVGLIGNNGVLFSESSLKGAQFIQICNQRRVPIIYLQNIMGFIIGKEYEHSGICKNGHKMVAAVACSEVPQFTVHIGGSFGAGNYAMCGRSFKPRFLFTWPNSRASVMGGRQAADVLVTITEDQRAREGLPALTDEEIEFIRQPIINEYEKLGSPYNHTAKMRDDGIIDPAKTRDVLGMAISASLNAPIKEPSYGIFRM